VVRAEPSRPGVLDDRDRNGDIPGLEGQRLRDVERDRDLERNAEALAEVGQQVTEQPPMSVAHD
jgi:hypothetical protein